VRGYACLCAMCVCVYVLCVSVSLCLCGASQGEREKCCGDSERASGNTHYCSTDGMHETHTAHSCTSMHINYPPGRTNTVWSWCGIWVRCRVLDWCDDEGTRMRTPNVVCRIMQLLHSSEYIYIQ